MATIDMQVVTVRETGRDRKFAYEISIELSEVGVSPWILIPEDVMGISYAVIIPYVTGEIPPSAKVEYTLDILQNVKDDTAEVLDWDKGEIWATATEYSVFVTAVRLKYLTLGDGGTIKLLLRAQ